MFVWLCAHADIQIVKENEAPGTWWDALNVTTADFEQIWFPSVQWGGWYDIFLEGNLFGFEGYQKNTKPWAQGRSRMVVDPLGHCQGAADYFNQDLIDGRVGLPVFLSLDLFKNLTWAENASAVTFYVMGPNVSEPFVGEFWTSLPDWPAFTPTEWFLSNDGSLVSEVPATSAAESFLYNPVNPVPSMGGNNLQIKCGPLDQRSIENRPDVLLFTSGVFADTVAITGPVNVRLFVSTDAKDTDFTAKFTDVYPDGTSRLIQDGIVRMRWRDAPFAGTEPRFVTAGEMYEVEVSLWNTSYVINAGHQIRLAVSSSNYPRFSANPNTGVPLASSDNTTVVANNTVFMGGATPSALILPVVPLSELPEKPVLDWVAGMKQRARDEGKGEIADFVDQLTQAHKDASKRLFDPATGDAFAAWPYHPLRGVFGDSRRA